MKRKIVIGLSIAAILSSTCLTSCTHKYEHKYLPIEISKLDSKGRVNSLTIFNYENRYRDCSISNFNIVEEDRYEVSLINMSYSEEGLIMSQEEVYNDEFGVFSYAYKNEYIYNNNGLISTTLKSFKDVDTPVYTPLYKSINDFDIKGNITQTEIYKYDIDSKSYIKAEYTTYLYDGLGVLSEKKYIDEFGNEQRTLYYNENGKYVIVNSIKEAGNDNYINEYKEETATVLNDENNKKIVTNMYLYLNDAWVLDSYHLTEYDNRENILVDEYKIFEDGNFKTGIKDEYTYDKHYNISNHVKYVKGIGDSNYILEVNDKYIYNDANELFKIEHYYTDDVLDEFDLYFLDNKGNPSRIEYYSCLNEFEYIALGSYSIKYKTVTTLSNMYLDFDPFNYI